MYLIIVKYPLVQTSVPKLPLLTFDQNLCLYFTRLLILLLHVLLTGFFFVILLLLSAIAALHTGFTITCYHS